MPLTDLARTDVVTVSPDTTVAALAATMRDETVWSVIVTEGDAPVGVVTDRDVAIRIAADRLDPDQMTAGDMMTVDPVTVGPDVGVMELCALMREESIRRVPVVDDGALVGIITLDDLTVLLASELGNLAGVIEAESPPN